MIMLDIFTQWSPDLLRHILQSELPDADLIVVSNREPYVHEKVGDEIALTAPASGMVSALEPIVRTCSGTWIAHGSGSGDREASDADGRLAVPVDKPSYTLRRVWLNDAEVQGHYSGFSNEGLWPLCHIAFTRPIFRAKDWEYYRAVNRKFADAVVEEAKTDRPLILIQDYHFALLPRMIRERLPDAVILTFWHIPWPNAEVFGVCPWHKEILDGLLASSILGFHIPLHCNNFIDAVDRYLEARIDKEESSITYGGSTTIVRPYPISIEWPEPDDEGDSCADARERVIDRFELPPDVRLAVGVERLDYTKGILQRFHGLEAFFAKHPEWIGRLTFIEIAAPSRADLRSYRQLQRECRELVDDINKRYGRDGYKPIILLIEQYDHDQLRDFYRAADLFVVSSLHDGMNLVAKEFVAAREDEAGALVLSQFAGAARELTEALIVNPYDADAMGEAFFLGLTMPEPEVRDRMRHMRATVRDNNVFRWAGTMLIDAARLKKRVAGPAPVDEAGEPV
jgi:trehalose 6-phosphate synthase